MLKELSRTYLAISKELVRVMNRLKALYRGSGISCSGRSVYVPSHREAWLKKITEPGVRLRAEYFYQQAGHAATVAPRGAPESDIGEPKAQRDEDTEADSNHRSHPNRQSVLGGS